MGLNKTPSGNRLHIGFFGKRNSGKSSIVNAITGQDIAVVSDVKGTTTDPVYKAMELLPLGPVMVIDTPGIDDEGPLGELRIRKTCQVLNKTDLAVLVIDAATGKTKEDEELIKLFDEKELKYIIAYNKVDLVGADSLSGADSLNGEESLTEENNIYVSATTGYNIKELKEKIAALACLKKSQGKIVGELINPGDFVVLVTPIDESAPKGRLILPQQQTIRDILDTNATAIVVQDSQLGETLANLGQKPKLVITDSKVFGKVAKETPEDIYLTSFSILFARYKGNLETAVKGAKALESLQDGDTILISEGCTHHRQCEDIGTVKLPSWIKNYTKKDLNFEFTAGRDFPDDLSGYKLIVHCGGCTLNEREMKYRQKCAEEQQIPITNYGILISYMNGILKRSIAIFPQILAEIEGS
ncbi:MAG: [FeFe] hydrogenase H-cluster maturation GTPase HydF [Desulfitobacterium sp.]|nr:[FeFe] hydrogenase H-cluster maturation GTPase HydF [Desulfitobacterium sp.]